MMLNSIRARNAYRSRTSSAEKLFIWLCSSMIRFGAPLPINGAISARLSWLNRKPPTSPWPTREMARPWSSRIHNRPCTSGKGPAPTIGPPRRCIKSISRSTGLDQALARLRRTQFYHPVLFGHRLFPWRSRHSGSRSRYDYRPRAEAKHQHLDDLRSGFRPCWPRLVPCLQLAIQLGPSIATDWSRVLLTRSRNARRPETIFRSNPDEPQ